VPNFTESEKNEALNDTSNGKATGPDKLPAEVHKHSPAGRQSHAL